MTTQFIPTIDVNHLTKTKPTQQQNNKDGSPTPQYAAYGATKAALPQLARTLRLELSAARARGGGGRPRSRAASPSASSAGAGAGVCADPSPSPSPSPSPPSSAQPSPVGVHVLSPGMMLTPLLLDGATLESLRVFNLLCEHPETAAAFLVPRMRSAVARGDVASYVRYLTPWSALWRFLTAPARAGRFFDPATGEPRYAAERERILGAGARATRRAQARAAARGGAVRAAYSLSVAACVAAVLAAEAVARTTTATGGLL